MAIPDYETLIKADAYVAINELLQAAQGEIIVLHHQDILLLEDGRAALGVVLQDHAYLARHRRRL